MKRLKVTITQADIEAAGCHADDCPIAQAIRRELPDAHSVYVFWTVTVSVGKARYRYELTKAAARFMDRWDTLKQARPQVLQFDPAAVE